MRILEVTIAILLVSGVLIMVYSKQISKPDPNEFVYSMQEKILMDISLRNDLRLMVLRGTEDDLRQLNIFVKNSMPSLYGYSFRVCDLGDTCELAGTTAIENFREDVDVFVEETIVSAVVTNGTGGQVYSPKKVKLFVWEAR